MLPRALPFRWCPAVADCSASIRRVSPGSSRSGVATSQDLEYGSLAAPTIRFDQHYRGATMHRLGWCMAWWNYPCRTCFVTQQKRLLGRWIPGWLSRLYSCTVERWFQHLVVGGGNPMVAPGGGVFPVPSLVLHWGCVPRGDGCSRSFQRRRWKRRYVVPGPVAIVSLLLGESW